MSCEKLVATVAGRPASYVRAGNGPELLVLHTSGGPLWTPLLELLSTGRQVYMPVLPGFGGSEMVDGVNDVGGLADWVAAFKHEVIGESPVDVFGGSFGGQVALHLAANHADCVETMVLEAPSGVVAGPPTAGRPTLFAYPEKAKDLLPDAATAKANSEAFRAYGGTAPSDPMLADLLPGIHQPTLVIMGTLDAVVPAQSGQYLARHLPNCKLTYLYDAGHGAQVDQPERMFRVMRHFLDKGPAFIVANREYA
ncbi:alpha/beta fold hydrolase [Croceicoccus estronivorus]|uniref:alpha/beta fold hydrolase n=1 Tax=Croceicoccus estronivorus TaxID=1172626 RepID=UPI000AE66D4F|nr:alpha/beta fold hydrolase [Croceicoccus estronivorus]